MLNLIESLDPTDLNAITYRLKHGGSHKKQAIARAVGTSNKFQLKVIDATCGFGTDAIILAYFNCKIFAIEKNPTVAKFFNDRLQAAQNHTLLAPILKNIKLFTGNCLSVIPFIIKKYNFIPDVIYLDPMFNHKTKAAPNKFIQVLKNILITGNQTELEHKNDNDLFEEILKYNVTRIVVKRAKNSSYLKDLKPTFIISGKANRFDVYLKNAINKTL